MKSFEQKTVISILLNIFLSTAPIIGTLQHFVNVRLSTKIRRMTIKIILKTIFTVNVHLLLIYIKNFLVKKH